MATDLDYNLAVKRLIKIYRAQARQLVTAYKKIDHVSWRRHPLSPLTPKFLSHLTTNLIHNSNGEYKRPRVLDLGCGAGEKTDRLRSFGIDIVGVDNLEAALEKARKLAKRRLIDSTMEIVKGDLKDLPFENETFDGAHDYLSFLHIVKEEWPRYIRSVYKVLKKKAPLLLVTFSGNDPYFYGYPINTLDDRGIVFSDKYHVEIGHDPRLVAHLVNSYFYFPKKEEILVAFKNLFDIIQIREIPHPLHKISPHHNERRLWHILFKKR